MLTAVSDIKNRMFKDNKNYLCIVMGAVGTGKSYTALRLCELIDPGFSIRNVLFSAEDFIKRLRDPDIKKGSCLIMDEAGVSVGSRDFWTTENKRVSYVCQTFRHRNLCVFFTVPSIKYIDSQVRPLFSGEIVTKRIEKSKKKCVVKWYQLTSSEITGRVYRRWYTKNGSDIEETYISKASPALIRAYEKKKLEYSDQLQEKALNDIKREREKTEIKEPNKKCDKCDYEWYYSGQKPRPQCPQCLRRIKE